MKQSLTIIRIIVLIFILNLIVYGLKAQPGDCVLLPPAINIDFGRGNTNDINLVRIPKYERDFTTCPADGFYSFVSNTSGCFNNDWLTFNTDHTSNGNMMLVNASETGGVFFTTLVNGLKPNTTYQFGVWMVNVCRINGGCSPLPPNITVRLFATSGKKVAEFISGELTQNDVPRWKKYFGYFVTPADASTLMITMEDNTLGGCGNDFALDDITFCECVKPQPVIQSKPERVKEITVKPAPPKNKTEPGRSRIKEISVKKEAPVLSTEKPVAGLPVTTLAIDEKPITISVPQPILTRENPIVKRIETEAGEILIDLYDNGEIDGDTVSIYHNNELIISQAGLSDKPIHFQVKVDAKQPHHELVMVANNLGSIPPNTSLMIITANGKRYEVHISSSEQKNAKVLINLKE